MSHSFKRITHFGGIILCATIFPLNSLYAAVTTAANCGNTQLENNYDISVPCIGIAGVQYQTKLEYQGNTDGVPTWKVGASSLSNCSWNYQSCSTLAADGTLNLLNFSLNGVANDAQLQKVTNSNSSDVFFKYIKHQATPTKSGHSSSTGTLSPLQKTAAPHSNVKKLLAIYMVGSDLENSWNQAATLDLKELLQGYKALGNSDLQVVVAFGGANKDGWRGMTIATIEQLLADAEDGQFGNGSSYLYQEPKAHMGDSSSLQLFLESIKQNYPTPAETFMAFWDHGGDYNGFGMDENYNNDVLSLPEIQKTLVASGLHFQLIGFDACLMGGAEVANYLHQSGDYLLSSEELEPGHGWNWQNMIALYASNASLVDRAKSMIDSYTDSSTHAYKSAGKTLSLVDLNQFDKFKAQTEAFLTSLNVNLRQNIGPIIDDAALALSRTRTYTENYNISIDLLDFATNILGIADASNPAEAKLLEQINALIDVTQHYVLYSRHDGTRPYSYGVSINPPNNKPNSNSLGNVQTSLQTTWGQLVNTDSDKPVASNQQNNVGANQANLSETTFTDVDLLALQGIITQLFSSGSISQAQYDLYVQGLEVLKKPDLTAEEKMLELEKIENNSKGVIPRGIFARGIYARGIYARGIAPRGLNARSISARHIAARHAEVAYQDTLPFLTGERAAFVYQPGGIKPRGIMSRTQVKGTLAKFTDSHPLTVKTIYGTVRTDVKTNEQLFETVAELEAYPTNNDNEYFTPSWNRVWYNVKFDDNQPTQWMPLSFVKRFRENNQTLTVYNSRLQYQDGNKTYPDLKADPANKAVCTQKGYVIDEVDNCVELANLEIVVNDTNEVVQHKVTSFKQLSQAGSDADSFIFDKVSNQLKAGDRIRFLFETANLTTGATGLWGSTTREAFINFKRTPIFGTELLAFVNKDNGATLDFYYAMRATDIAGKSVTAEPQVAPVDLPSCSKLLPTQQDLHAVSNYLSATTTRIQFNSDLGKRFDEANATLLTIDDATHSAVLSDKVQRLIGLLYNPSTLDKVNATWVWDNVNFSSVKAVVDEVTPEIDSIYKQNCTTTP